MASAERRALYITMQDPAPLAGKESPPGGKSPGQASPGQAPTPTPAGADLPGGASAEPGAAPAPSSDQPKVVPAQTFSEELAGRPVRINYASYPRVDVSEERMRQFLLRQGDDDDLDARERASRSALRKTGAASAPYDADSATTKAPARSKSRHSKEVYDDRRRRKSRRAQGSSSSSSSGDSRRGSSDKRPRRKRSHKSRERNRKPRRRHRSSSSSSSIDNRRGERSPAKGKNKSNEIILQIIQRNHPPVDSWQQQGTGRVWGNEQRLLDAPGTVFATPSERSGRQSSTFDVKVDSQRTKLAGSVFRYESHPTTDKGHKD